ncbi:SDR family oxidoreductase [Prosthecomicrobium sp. N25]|uniref:SDR family oxidoreductase n=1 Tax=Prosthecomicrobium sp. N25 TaxID=3129254 RepID=UPI0030768F6D
MPGKILVLGATGTIGSHLVPDLVARGEAVRAASRTGAAVAGAEGVRFDLTAPETWDAAFEGADRVFVIAPTGTVDPLATLGPVVERAAARGLKIVLMTAMGVDASDEIPYRKVELALIRSGARHVIVRPTWFADNFHTFWSAGVKAGVIALPAGEGRTAFIDTRDIAASIAGALTTDRFDGRAIDLTGPKSLTYTEAAAILSRVAGRTIAYRATTDEAFVAMLTGAGVSPAYAAFLAAIFHPVREGWADRVTDGVERLSGRPPRSLEAYAADHAAAFRA